MSILPSRPFSDKEKYVVCKSNKCRFFPLLLALFLSAGFLNFLFIVPFCIYLHNFFRFLLVIMLRLFCFAKK